MRFISTLVGLIGLTVDLARKLVSWKRKQKIKEIIVNEDDEETKRYLDNVLN
jgi:hypothetical protein